MKGDSPLCGSYRGFKYLEYGMKMWEVLYEQLKRSRKYSDCQLGFTVGKSATDGIFIMRHLQKKYKTKKGGALLCATGSGKVFHSVLRRTVI